jgi:hypothetical protein
MARQGARRLRRLHDRRPGRGPPLQLGARRPPLPHLSRHDPLRLHHPRRHRYRRRFYAGHSVPVRETRCQQAPAAETCHLMMPDHGRSPRRRRRRSRFRPALVQQSRIPGLRPAPGYTLRRARRPQSRRSRRPRPLVLALPPRRRPPPHRALRRARQPGPRRPPAPRPARRPARPPTPVRPPIGRRKGPNQDFRRTPAHPNGHRRRRGPPHR